MPGRIRLLLAAAAAVVAATSGCGSIRSTMYAYNGCNDCDRVQLRCLKGVPTTLSVPTHLKVTVTRTRVGKVDPATGGVVFVKDLETVGVDIQPIEQKQIFTVDFKRPASGSLDYSLTFDKDRQYITGVDNQLVDTTIQDVSGLVAAVIKAVPAGARVRSATDPGVGLTEVSEVIACELFSLGEPNLQERVQAFLAAYVNNCAPVCGPCPFPGPAPCQTCATPAGPAPVVAVPAPVVAVPAPVAPAHHP